MKYQRLMHKVIGIVILLLTLYFSMRCSPNTHSGTSRTQTNAATDTLAITETSPAPSVSAALVAQNAPASGTAASRVTLPLILNVTPVPTATIPIPGNPSAEAATPIPVVPSNTAVPPTPTPRPRNVTVRSDGSLIVDGNPMFPIGMTHISWAGDDERRLADLQAIAAAGFNTLYVAIDLDDDAFLQAAERLGVHIMVIFNADPLDVVKKYRDHPAILGWHIADDPEDTTTVEEIIRLHNQVKTLDPNHITSISISIPDRFNEYMECSDVVGIMSYPVPLEPISSTFSTIFRAHQVAAAANRPIWGNLQSYGYENRPPNPKEARNMMYQSFIAGAKGDIFYAYFDSGWDMRNNLDLWNGLTTLVQEAEVFSPILLDGALMRLETGMADVRAGYWIYNNHTYVVILNTSPTQTANISLAIPSISDGVAQTLFADRPAGMILQNGVLTGSISPEDVHVYVLPAPSL